MNSSNVPRQTPANNEARAQWRKFPEALLTNPGSISIICPSFGSRDIHCHDH